MHDIAHSLFGNIGAIMLFQGEKVVRAFMRGFDALTDEKTYELVKFRKTNQGTCINLDGTPLNAEEFLKQLVGSLPSLYKDVEQHFPFVLSSH